MYDIIATFIFFCPQAERTDATDGGGATNGIADVEVKE